VGDEKISTTNQLLDGILKGEVPRQVRLFAAQGMLPVSREDLLRLQVVLSADPDEELAGFATDSLAEVTTEVLVAWVQGQDLESMVLDLLIRVRDDDEIWASVAQAPNTSDETLRVMARHGSRLIQDIIMTNQVRVLQCLELLDDLRANPHVDQVILRRVKEFEEEFIEKALKDAIDGADGYGPTIEEAIAALRSIGAHIPRESDLPYPESDDAGLRDAVEKAGTSTYGRILTMDVKERIMCALKGSREERSILISSRNRLVVRAVMASPKLSDPEVEKFAASRSVSDEVIRVIASNPRWTRMYPILIALAFNPKTPPALTLRMLPRLSIRDIGRLGRDRNVNPVIRRQAKDLFDRRR
jgi:hypothetical protein